MTPQIFSLTAAKTTRFPLFGFEGDTNEPDSLS
jgi:hypothetical protein